MTKKRGLGRGIGALIPNLDEGALAIREGLLQVNVEEIKENPFQPRKNFTEQEMKELTASVKEKGILTPILVRKTSSGYQLIAGERRLRAAYSAGLLRVPVKIVDADDSEMQELALIENVQREDLNVIEEAEGYQSLIDRFNHTQDEVAQKVGKSRTVITNALRLLKLGSRIKEDIVQNRISMGHARAYLGLDTPALQEEVHKAVMKRGFSVRQTESYIRRLKKPTKKKKNQHDTTQRANTDFIIEELQKRYGTKVSILRKGNKGKVVLEFYSNDEFERIFDLLRGFH